MCASLPRVSFVLTGGVCSLARLTVCLPACQVAFDLGVVHVDEGAALGLGEDEAERFACSVRDCAASCAGESAPFIAVAIEDVFCDGGSCAVVDRAERRHRLNALLQVGWHSN
jgi:hypothetical protein